MARQLKNQPGTWLSVAWEEYVGRDSSHGASWATGWDDGSQSTFQIVVNWTDGLQAELSLLGSATFNGSGLSRTLPARHPVKSWMFAERILSAEPVQWSQKLNTFVSGNITTQAGAPVSQYSYWLLTIGFVNPKYRVLSDADLQNKFGAAQEWNRFCEVHNRTRIEMISREGGAWKWLDGGGSGPTVGNPLTAPVGVGIYGGEIIVKWKRVPRKGLYGNNGENDFFNTNIVSARNKVHNGATALWGFSTTGTGGFKCDATYGGALRFIDAEATPIPSPFDPNAQGLGASSYNLYYDVDLHFAVWMPPAGNANRQGWNLGPNPGDNLWWLIGSNPTGNPIFQVADLSTVFTLSAT